MYRLLTILAYLLLSALINQGGCGVVCNQQSGQSSVSSLYVEQIAASHSYNNTIHLNTSISVPVTGAVQTAVRGQWSRDISSSSMLHSVAANNSYCIRFAAYLLSGRRVLEYYLYSLCQLRL